MKTINRITSIMDRICLFVASCLMAFICLVIVAQVVVRKFGGTIIWVDEMTRYAFICLVLFGTVDLARQGGHISITSFVDMLPPAARRIAYIVIYALVTGYSAFMVYAYIYAIGNYEGVYFSVVKAIPMSGFYALVAVLMALITVQSALHIVDLAIGGSDV